MEANAQPLSPAAEDAVVLARQREFTTEVALLFVVLSILALALVPFLHLQRVAQIEARVQTVLEPGQRAVSEYAFVQVRGMAQMQSFLMSNDILERDAHRTRYHQLRAQGDSLFVELSNTVASLGIREKLTALDNASTDWHLNHVEVLSGGQPVGSFEASGELALYDALLSAAAAVQSDLFERLEPARTEIASARRRQMMITWVLLMTALIASLVVSFIARRLRSLTQETEAQWRAAVESRREADAVLAGTADGVLGVDLEGRCVFLNRAGAELLGRVPSDLLGRDVHDMVLPTRPDGSPYPRQESPLARALESTDMVFTSDEIFWRRDGSSFPVRLSCRPMVDGRQVRGAVLSFVDLTKIREVEEQLREAVRARDEVVSVVSHDLRNPVGTIYIAADLLLDIPLPPEKQREQLAAIKRQAKQMEHLIKDLLDVSRIEAGTFPIQPEPEDLGALVEDALLQFGPITERRGIRLHADVPASLPVVRADRGRILQVLWNLVGNAIKYSPNDTEVRVRVRRRDHQVEVSVQDSGPGIDPEDLPKIFDRFWQVGGKSDGAGLGLAIVKGIVDAHDGTIHVRSRLGEGSEFSFGLPIWRDDPEPASEQPEPELGVPSELGAAAG